MASLIPRQSTYICRACQLTRASPTVSRRSFATVCQTFIDSPVTTRQSQPKRKLRSKWIPIGSRNQRPRLYSITKVSRSGKSPTPQPSQEDLPAQCKRVQEAILEVLDAESVPDKAKLTRILSEAKNLAGALSQDLTTSISDTEVSNPAGTSSSSVQNTSRGRQSLFDDLDEPQAKARKASSILSQAQRASLSSSLAKALYTLLEDPKVFISPSILATYVETLAILNLPEYIPKILYLYAHKPIPKPGSSPVQFSQPRSNAPKYAIPPSIVEMAMTSAIAKRDMPLCISIIDTTVATPQFQSAKFMSKAFLPLLGAGMIVPLSWQLSRKAADWQLSWDPDTFFWMCMAGGGAYLGTMGTLLLITVTTWNDHHKRVRWVPGTPLGRRWFREDERYWFDRMAQAWGFKEENRHGEEAGEEWEALREVLALRYMDLDRSALLPGML